MFKQGNDYWIQKDVKVRILYQHTCSIVVLKWLIAAHCLVRNGKPLQYPGRLLRVQLQPSVHMASQQKQLCCIQVALTVYGTPNLVTERMFECEFALLAILQIYITSFSFVHNCWKLCFEICRRPYSFRWYTFSGMSIRSLIWDAIP